MEDSHYIDLLVELECPICTNYMSPPIRQCATGHSICEDCRRKLPQCALCQGSFTESRNITLEGLAVKMRYPCINKNSGCTLKLAYNEREIHESRCQFKGYTCAMEKCPWIGRLEDLAQHWASKKMSSKPFCASNVCRAKIKQDSYYVNIIEAHNTFFWFKFKLVNKKMHWAVQYIGKSEEAQKFYYEIEVSKQNLPKCKMYFSLYCQPVDMDNSALFKNGHCISLPVELIESFINDEQVLVYHMRVHPVKGEKPQQSAGIVATEHKQRDRSKGPHRKNKLTIPAKKVK